MNIVKISPKEYYDFIGKENPTNSFPKYTTFLINQAARTAQATRPSVVGQMSELIEEFRKDVSKVTFSEWEKWYMEKFPDAIELATDKTLEMLNNFDNAMKEIDRELVKEWVRDLTVTKTYTGLLTEKIVIIKVAEEKGEDYKYSSSQDESKGIDGYIGKRAISVKPDTYKNKPHLLENINAEIIFYSKDSQNNLKVEYDF